MKGFERPKAIVLPSSASVPRENLIVPPPSQFTHELTRDQPFYFTGPQQGRAPDGQLAAGTRVVLLEHEGSYCRVADGRGLCVEIECDSLKKL
jgi:hypothetical protein